MFKPIVISACVAVALAAAAPGHAADVGFDVKVFSEVRPGVYGRLEIGNAAPPPVVYPQPVVIAPPPPQAVAVQPIYLHVPPDHASDWAHHCHRYHACDRPVYFVRSEEYGPVHHGWSERERHEQWEREQRHEEWEREQRHAEGERWEHDRGHRDHD